MSFYINKFHPIPTEAYSCYWHFAAERQKIFYKQVSGDLFLTGDSILQEYKFTNAYRASDRVSQYLIKNVIYDGDQTDINDLFFRILFFKIFNKIETWEYIQDKLRNIVWQTFDFSLYDELLRKRMNRGEKIYSNAYMMPSATTFKQPKKHTNHLMLIQKMMKENLPQRIANAKSLEDIYLLLKSYPSIGNFLAFQYAIDLNYSELINFSENDFVVAGPGAIDGISKCFSNSSDYTSEDIIKYMTDNQEKEFKKYDIGFNYLGDRKLHLIDCQNIFCEVSKYTRVALPHIQGVAKRTRIKQKYHSKGKAIDYFYPPKWNIKL